VSCQPYKIHDGHREQKLQIIRHDCQDYLESIREQEQLVTGIIAEQIEPALIFTEHRPVYTIGTSGTQNDILETTVDGEKIAVVATGRGGEVTYHGPGQLICYVLADLRKEQDLHRHVWRLEEMIILALSEFGIVSDRQKRGIGVWTGGEKIAAIGVRCRRWVTLHGVALNISPNLRHFSGIVPCGMRDAPVTSMQALGIAASREQLESRLLPHAEALFAE